MKSYHLMGLAMIQTHTPDQPAHHPNRESWLHALTDLLRPRFADLGFPIPSNLRISIGFTSRGRRGKAVAEVWHETASRDGHYEIFIGPGAESPLDVAKSLCHELAHAAAGLDCGHKGDFVVIMRAFGFQAPFKSSRAKPAPAFEALFTELFLILGPFPHGTLNADAATSGPRKQGTRLVKCACAANGCGYTVRTTAKWLEVGAPICPVPDHGPMVPELPEDLDDPEGQA